METCAKAILDALQPLRRKKSSLIIAIDGRCASGKTTLAARLQALTDAQVIHLDDFFLRPEQRSTERRATPGENVDWERLTSEVLTPLSLGQAFTYRPFDCHTLGFKNAITGGPAALTILEGTYSCNSHLWPYSDLHIFLTISPEEQRRRIAQRNTPEDAKRFYNLWIPLEERYFAASDVADRCDILCDGHAK